MKHNHYEDIVGNVIVGWKCYKCNKKLNWLKVMNLGMVGYYD